LDGTNSEELWNGGNKIGKIYFKIVNSIMFFLIIKWFSRVPPKVMKGQEKQPYNKGLENWCTSTVTSKTSITFFIPKISFLIF